MTTDPAFVTAIERAYLSVLRELEPTGESEPNLHREILDRAIYRADPTHGGLRYKALPDVEELEARLARALSHHLEGELASGSEAT